MEKYEGINVNLVLMMEQARRHLRARNFKAARGPLVPVIYK